MEIITFYGSEEMDFFLSNPIKWVVSVCLYIQQFISLCVFQGSPTNTYTINASLLIFTELGMNIMLLEISPSTVSTQYQVNLW